MNNQGVKISGTSSYINVEIDGKRIRISGEMMSGGFLAYKDSIKNWDFPESRPVTAKEKQMIIDAVTVKTVNSHMIITFQ